MSVNEIAELMNCSTGTVKSRLNYARKAIKEAVVDLEKNKGTKLYSIAGIPLLYLAYREMAEMAPVKVPAAKTVSSVSTKVAKTAATATAKKGLFAGVGAKIAAGLATVALISAGAGAFIHFGGMDLFKKKVEIEEIKMAVINDEENDVVDYLYEKSSDLNEYINGSYKYDDEGNYIELYELDEEKLEEDYEKLLEEITTYMDKQIEFGVVSDYKIEYNTLCYTLEDNLNYMQSIIHLDDTFGSGYIFGETNRSDISSLEKEGFKKVTENINLRDGKVGKVGVLLIDEEILSDEDYKKKFDELINTLEKNKIKYEYYGPETFNDIDKGIQAFNDCNDCEVLIVIGHGNFGLLQITSHAYTKSESEKIIKKYEKKGVKLWADGPEDGKYRFFTDASFGDLLEDFDGTTVYFTACWGASNDSYANMWEKHKVKAFLASVQLGNINNDINIACDLVKAYKDNDTVYDVYKMVEDANIFYHYGDYLLNVGMFVDNIKDGTNYYLIPNTFKVYAYFYGEEDEDEVTVDEKEGKLVITVKDGNGKPITEENIVVSVRGEYEMGEYTGVVETSLRGEVTLKYKPGNYYIYVAASDYALENDPSKLSEEKLVTIKDTGKTEVTFVINGLGDDESSDDDSLVSFTYNGHAYKLYEDAYDWNEAKEKCEERGGYLAILDADEENKAVYDLLIENNYESAYFGLSIVDGVWQWVDGSAASFTNWAPGEPNNEFSGESYALFYYKFVDAQWNDGTFELKGIPYLCEFDEELSE